MWHIKRGIIASVLYWNVKSIEPTSSGSTAYKIICDGCWIISSSGSIAWHDDQKWLMAGRPEVV